MLGQSPFAKKPSQKQTLTSIQRNEGDEYGKQQVENHYRGKRRKQPATRKTEDTYFQSDIAVGMRYGEDREVKDYHETSKGMKKQGGRKKEKTRMERV